MKTHYLMMPDNSEEAGQLLRQIAPPGTHCALFDGLKTHYFTMPDSSEEASLLLRQLVPPGTPGLLPGEPVFFIRGRETAHQRDGFFALPDGFNPADLRSYATLLWHRDPYGLAEGYYLAAKAVIAEGRRPGTVFHNLAASPLLFLTRHWLELMLKAILIQANELEDTRARVYGHPLAPLWGKVRTYATDRWLGEDLPSAAFTEIDRAVSDLDAVDPDGVAFLYADKRANLARFVFGVDLDMLEGRLDRLHLSLDAIYQTRSEEHDREQEAAGEQP